jgi:hypothetical protein
LTLKVVDTFSLALRLGVASDYHIRGIWPALSDLPGLGIPHLDYVGAATERQGQQCQNYYAFHPIRRSFSISRLPLPPIGRTTNRP